MLADLSREAERAVERGDDGQSLRAARHNERTARDLPAEFGVLQQLPDRIVPLAREVARRLCSITARIAVSATAAGAITTDVRVAGWSGGTCARAGFFSGADGQSSVTTAKAATQASTTIKPPRTSLRMPAMLFQERP